MKTPEEKAALRAQGFIQAEGKGWCCACGKHISKGKWIRRMPPSFKGKRQTQHRMAHKACVLEVLADIEARTGKQVTL